MNCINEAWLHQFIILIVLDQSGSNYCNYENRREQINGIPNETPSEVRTLNQQKLSKLIQQEVQTEEVQNG